MKNKLILYIFIFIFLFNINVYAKDENYTIEVNKYYNTVTVFNNKNEIVRTMYGSCGKDTPIGTFYTPNKYKVHMLFGNVWGMYCTRIHEHILFHSVPYKSPNRYSLISRYYNQLGGFASMGCIRLPIEDAKWIYDNCKLKTKVVIKNDKTLPEVKPKAINRIPSYVNIDPTDSEVYNKYHYSKNKYEQFENKELKNLPTLSEYNKKKEKVSNDIINDINLIKKENEEKKKQEKLIKEKKEKEEFDKKIKQLVKEGKAFIEIDDNGDELIFIDDEIGE